MPSHPINRMNGDTASRVGQQQPYEGRQSPARAVRLDELIARLVSSNALPLAPPASPTMCERLDHRYNETRRKRRDLASELRRVQRYVTSSFHPVQGGRLVVLTLQ